MIATLPMYDPPWLRRSNDAFWTRLALRLRRRGLLDVPDRLCRGGDLFATWTSPSLMLGQTCGYPLVTSLQGRVQIVATPHYAAEGCTGPYHRAAIVVRRDDPAGILADLRARRAAINSRDSNSGMNLFRDAIAKVADGPIFFSSVIVTGSHATSFAALLSGAADVASIDAVTLALLRDRHPGQAERLRVLDWSEPSPTLPFITAADTPDSVVAILQDELAAEIEQQAPDSQRLVGLSLLALDDYAPLRDLERRAMDYGYPELR